MKFPKALISSIVIVLSASCATAMETGAPPLQGGSAAPGMMAPSAPGSISVNNRVLAKVNGKAISLVDVVKKMDVVFYREFAQYAGTPAARHQFYVNSWKPVLQELIDRELMLADAAEVKMEISGGDVRQELEAMFGPNIMETLDKIGITYDEAWEMIHTDLVIRRMMFARVNMKAIARVHPETVRDAYREHIAKQDTSEEWTYQVVTIRQEGNASSEVAASTAHDLLQNSKCSLSELESSLGRLGLDTQGITVKVGEPMTQSASKVSPLYREVLSTLASGEYSAPITQQSRGSTAPVRRIFYLAEKKEAAIPSFQEMEKTLKEQLIDMAVADETNSYLQYLRQHFSMNDALEETPLDDFQPFTLY